MKALGKKSVKTGLTTNTLIQNHVVELTNEILKEKLDESDHSLDSGGTIQTGSPKLNRKIHRKDQP